LFTPLATFCREFREENATLGSVTRLYDRAAPPRRLVDGDDSNRATRRRYTDDLPPWIFHHGSAAKSLAGSAREQHFGAVRGPGSLGIFGRGFGYLPGRSAAGRTDPCLAGPFFLPRRERDGRSIGRPCGGIFENLRGERRQATRFRAFAVCDPDFAE